MQHFNAMHPACVCCSIRALPRQPFHVALELQESSSMKDLRLSGCRDIDSWEFALHTRSPLVYNLNHPIKVWKGHPLPRPRKKTAMNAILVQVYLSQNGSIQTLKDDTCTPKPAKLNAWVYICVYTHTSVDNIHFELDFTWINWNQSRVSQHVPIIKTPVARRLLP